LLAEAESVAHRFRGAYLLGVPDDSSQLLLDLTLLVEEQFRIADHFDEQDVTNLQFSVGAHVRSVRRSSRSSLLCREYFLDKRLESGIAMQRIQERIDFDEGNAVSVAVFICLFEKINGAILLSKTNVDHREKIW